MPHLLLSLLTGVNGGVHMGFLGLNVDGLGRIDHESTSHKAFGLIAEAAIDTVLYRTHPCLPYLFRFPPHPP